MTKTIIDWDKKILKEIKEIIQEEKAEQSTYMADEFNDIIERQLKEGKVSQEFREKWQEYINDRHGIIDIYAEYKEMTEGVIEEYLKLVAQKIECLKLISQYVGTTFTDRA